MNDIADMPIIDRDHLARYTLGDVALEREVLGLFVDQIPETLGQLDGAGDDEERVRAAHTLKGSARAVGAKRLAEVAEEVEKAARERREIGDLRRALDMACSDVRELIKADC
jgi:HPt (histidine-containing phosphotransfer) domain-containing protein